MTLIIFNSRRVCLKMAYPITPSPSSRSANTIDLTTDDDGDIIAKNRMLIRKYKSSPAVLLQFPTRRISSYFGTHYLGLRESY